MIMHGYSHVPVCIPDVNVAFSADGYCKRFVFNDPLGRLFGFQFEIKGNNMFVFENFKR